MSWTISDSKQEMLLVLLSGGRRTHECESRLNEWAWRAVFGGVALLRTMSLFVWLGFPTVCFVERRLKESTSESVSGGVILLAAVCTRPGSAEAQGATRQLHDCRCESVSGGGRILDGFCE